VHHDLKLFFTQAQILRRLGMPITLLAVVLLGGALGYQWIGFYYGQTWSFLDCAFMAVISLLTVGYGDDLGVHQFEGGRVYTIALLLLGAGAAAYSFASITAFVVEGHIHKFFQERRMERNIDGLSSHTIICGCGTTGGHVIDEHKAAGVPFIVIDASAEAIDHARQRTGDFPFLVGDATDEQVLEQAGIERARALVSCLHEDKDNLFLVVAARYRRKDLPIVVKAIEHGSEGRFRAAGATDVVSPTFIGGMRLASLVVRPHVVGFLDKMLRAKSTARVSEAVVERGSQLDNKNLTDARIQDGLGLSVVALRRPSDDDFVYAPSGETLLTPGTTIIVAGPLDRVHELEGLASADGKPRPAPMS
jgi:voltage-gated potassium channel